MYVGWENTDGLVISTSFIIEQLFSQNSSIGQKNVILAAISMVVLELSGWDSYSNKGKDGDKGIDMNMVRDGISL
jgi:hypothetical protein